MYHLLDRKKRNISNDILALMLIPFCNLVHFILKRIIVAPTGSIFIDEEGESIEVTKASVGGVISEGMLCDSRMLGWSGGGKGVAVQIPDEFKIGSSPPASKPRPKLDESLEIPESSISGLYKKKLTKEEKKKGRRKTKIAKSSKVQRGKRGKRCLDSNRSILTRSAHMLKVSYCSYVDVATQNS